MHCKGHRDVCMCSSHNVVERIFPLVLVSMRTCPTTEHALPPYERMHSPRRPLQFAPALVTVRDSGLTLCSRACNIRKRHIFCPWAPAAVSTGKTIRSNIICN